MKQTEKKRLLDKIFQVWPEAMQYQLPPEDH